MHSKHSKDVLLVQGLPVSVVVCSHTPAATLEHPHMLSFYANMRMSDEQKRQQHPAAGATSAWAGNPPARAYCER